MVGETQGRSVTVLVAAADIDGPCGLSAADLASFESEKTRNKLKLKADHVSLDGVYISPTFLTICCTMCTAADRGQQYKRCRAIFFICPLYHFFREHMLDALRATL